MAPRNFLRGAYSREINEPPHDKPNKMTYAPSEETDQLGHPPSLIRVFAVRFMGSFVVLRLKFCKERKPVAEYSSRACTFFVMVNSVFTYVLMWAICCLKLWLSY